MDIWGHCTLCERWFYCEVGGDRSCPVCATPATTVEDRTAHQPRPIRAS